MIKSLKLFHKVGENMYKFAWSCIKDKNPDKKRKLSHSGYSNRESTPNRNTRISQQSGFALEIHKQE